MALVADSRRSCRCGVRRRASTTGFVQMTISLKLQKRCVACADPCNDVIRRHFRAAALRLRRSSSRCAGVPLVVRTHNAAAAGGVLLAAARCCTARASPVPLISLRCRLLRTTATWSASPLLLSRWLCVVCGRRTAAGLLVRPPSTPADVAAMCCRYRLAASVLKCGKRKIWCVTCAAVECR